MENQRMNEIPNQSWFSRNWNWVVPVGIWVVPLGCLAPFLLCCGGGVMLMFGATVAVRSSVPYTESLAKASANEEVQSALGLPIEPGFSGNSKFEVSGSSGHADISYPVTGPSGSANIHAIADKKDGKWTFTTMDIVIDGSGNRIDLLK